MKQKISVVIISRNDNYGGHLKERATYCLNSAIDTYDEVFYIDWNSPTHSLLYDIKDDINFKGNLKHIVITPKVTEILTGADPNAQVCCEVLARNIGIRRATGDWILSSNIDIIHPSREDVEEVISKMDPDTFYTISRRNIDRDIIEKHENFWFKDGKVDYKQWKILRSYLIDNTAGHTDPEKVVEGDDYSMVNCCGDYQIAKKHIWKDLRGFEEELIYCLYTDTNIQKKAAMHGFGLKALFSPAVFHIGHGKGGGGFCDGINKRTNDLYRAVTAQEKTENDEKWGFSDIEIEYETF